MAMPTPEKGHTEQYIKNLLNKLRNQLNNWKNKHQNFTDVEMQDMKQTLTELNKAYNQMGGKPYKDWNNLHKNINSRLNNPKNIKKNDFQNFNHTVQQLMKELK